MRGCVPNCVAAETFMYSTYYRTNDNIAQYHIQWHCISNINQTLRTTSSSSWLIEFFSTINGLPKNVTISKDTRTYIGGLCHPYGNYKLLIILPRLWKVNKMATLVSWILHRAHSCKRKRFSFTRLLRRKRHYCRHAVLPTTNKHTLTWFYISTQILSVTHMLLEFYFSIHESLFHHHQHLNNYLHISNKTKTPNNNEEIFGAKRS